MLFDIAKNMFKNNYIMRTKFSKQRILLIILTCLSFSLEAQVRITVDAAKTENRIIPYLYGACIEDVNHEIYGGLYDQRIFGESFEEPVPQPKFKHFTPYEGNWNVTSRELSVSRHAGAKLVYDPILLDTGTVETEIKFENDGENAGLLLRVTKPGNGADRFYGYEVSLSADGKKIVIGKHKNNFAPIKEVPINCNPKEWNLLKAAMHNGKIRVFLNNKIIYTFDDYDESLKNGKIALRTWNSNVKFRNVKVSSDNSSETLTFTTIPQPQISDRWDAVKNKNVSFSFFLDTYDAYNGKNSQVIEYISGNGSIGISNSSLNRWGIAVNKGQTFKGRLYLKSPNLKGNVTVALQSNDGKKEYARYKINGVNEKWNKYSFELTSNNNDTNARFTIFIDKPGKLWIDQVTLMSTGKYQFKGLPFRNDIGQAIVNQGLNFLRYGGTMVNAPEYRFKKMIGDRDKRPPYRGHWYSYSTNGFGIEDFLQFCEAAGFTPSFAINIEETAEDAADMIEYLNGSTDTKWGKIRAQNGHPKPYGVKYIEIGNEEVIHSDDAAGYDHYIDRFNEIYEAIRSKDTSVVFINAAWWRPNSPNMERVFHALNGKAAYWDYHPWADDANSGERVEKELICMRNLFKKWDKNTTMKCAIFEENGNTHNMQRALGHATIMNTNRRIGDFLLTSCAANALQPYRQNDNGWDQGQIFFTPSQVWGMPPYYAQQMAAETHQPLRVYSNVEGKEKKLDVTATRSENGKELVLHIVNTEKSSVSADLTINGFGKIKKAKTITLSGNPNDINTPDQPKRITPEGKEIKKSGKQAYEIAPFSYTIFVFSK